MAVGEHPWNHELCSSDDCNSFGVASLGLAVVGCALIIIGISFFDGEVGLFLNSAAGIAGIVAVIFGRSARARVKRGQHAAGDGALAGIILGAVIAMPLLLMLFLFVLAAIIGIGLYLLPLALLCLAAWGVKRFFTGMRGVVIGSVYYDHDDLYHW